MEFIEKVDHKILLIINTFGNEGFDWLMIAFSHKFFWIPLYLFLVYLLFKKYKIKLTLLFILGAIVTIAITDRTSVELFKEVFLRYRPCHNLDLQHLLRLPDGCGGKFGFLSSHAANTAGLATFISFSLSNKKITYLMLGYALVNGYSRIYLGKHYPTDVIAGFLLGLFAGFCIYFITDKIRTRFYVG